MVRVLTFNKMQLCLDAKIYGLNGNFVKFAKFMYRQGPCIAEIAITASNFLIIIALMQQIVSVKGTICISLFWFLLFMELALLNFMEFINHNWKKLEKTI